MKFSKILIFLGISCIAGLLLVFGIRLQAQDEAKVKPIAVTENQKKLQAAQHIEEFRNRQRNWGTQGRQQASRWGGQQRSETSGSKDSSDFYKVIVDNNIFRPLGWRPPNKEPEYTFVYTRVESNKTESKAALKERRSNQQYIVQIGQKVGDAIVKDIKDKEIILEKNGEIITLRRREDIFLQSGGSRRSGSSSRSNVSVRTESSSNNKESSSKSFDKNAAMAKAKAAAELKAKEAMRMAQEMRRRFEGASRGDRERMIREFRESGGFRERRGGDR